jgi:hypothetical protein
MLLLLVIAGSVPALPTVKAQANAARLGLPSDAPPSGWIKIPGGPGTVCSLGTPYSFFYRAANPEKLMVYLQGGGACWRSSNCDPAQQPTYDRSIGPDDDPKPTGIFDFGNAENPLADYSVLFVPYCTGDVHLGDTEADYAGPAASSRGSKDVAITLRVHHNGYRNAMAAIEWASRRVTAPREVVVAGESAGAIASPFYADEIAARYPKARIVQLGDSAGGYRAAAVAGLLEGWGATRLLRGFPNYVPADARTIRFETLYTAAARNHPAITLAQFNAADDETQVFFLAQIGVANAKLPPLLDQNHADIRAIAPGLRTFTAPGTVHVILRRPQFYSVEAGGVRLRDWVANLVAGRPAGDVSFTSGKQTAPAPVR